MQIKHYKNGAKVTFYGRRNFVLQIQKFNFKDIIIIGVIMCFFSTLKQLKAPGTKVPYAVMLHWLNLSGNCRPWSLQGERVVISSFSHPWILLLPILCSQLTIHSERLSYQHFTYFSSIGNWGIYHSNKLFFERPKSHYKSFKIATQFHIQVLV